MKYIYQSICAFVLFVLTIFNQLHDRIAESQSGLETVCERIDAHIRTSRQLGMLLRIQRWYMIKRDKKECPQATTWQSGFFFASPEDMKGSKCQKGIHLNRFKVTLPPYTSETTRLCHFHRRWRHRTCPCESVQKIRALQLKLQIVKLANE